MIYFNNDYSEGCCQPVLDKLVASNMVQSGGYGVDIYCEEAAAKIKTLCRNDNLSIHFMVGGTQTNMTVINALLRSYQGVLSAVSGHINVHETGAVESTGHKVLALASDDGKITAKQIADYVQLHRSSADAEHTVQPKMVYISNPTELGTIYSLAELEQISTVCHRNGLYLFLDGARLGYGLTAKGNDVTLSDLARLCDVFYIGGTKVGALFGEAVVFSNLDAAEDFRYMIKQHGAMLAKGRLLGVQFSALMENDTYFTISKHANQLADKIRATIDELGYTYLVPGVTNQIFAVFPDVLLDELAKEFTFSEQERIDDTHRAVRFCTSWATTESNVDALCNALKRLSK